MLFFYSHIDFLFSAAIIFIYILLIDRLIISTCIVNILFYNHTLWAQIYSMYAWEPT